MIKDDQHRLNELLQQWQNHTLPRHHRKELLSLLERSDLEHPLTEEMQKIWEETQTEEVFHPVQKEAMLASIVSYRQPRRIPIRYLMLAAVLLALILMTGVLLWQQQPARTATITKKEPIPVVQTADVTAPTVNKAILTLADGRQIVLENMGEGSLATEGNVNVIKLADGQLVYTGNTTEVKWNTLTVPKGSKPMRLTLSDGSQVTLNVASSLTYPTAFSGNSRNVSMTGEAYFEVTHVSSDGGSGNQPFVVAMNGMSVEVKGTKFNVNAYEDEAAVKTTLVEGAVNIVAGDQHLAIATGEQAVVATDVSSGIKLKKKADVEEAMAWINGKFRFHNADVEAVMRQVARWYDVEVKFAAKPAMRFGGQIDRNSTLRQMFTILETSGLNFSLSGNRVTILP
jgi:ferric-dicitrate binding protein FerR (iron transport regulator)